MKRVETLVSLHEKYASEKEVEFGIWKPCFYFGIEEFRRRIRRYATASGKDESLVGHFNQVTAQFQAFLQNATEFYTRLNASFVAGLEKNGSLKSKLSSHRCLVLLGDLARYRELHSAKGKKEYSASQRYYYQALDMYPANGNPHNQLAVLATYVDDELVAVYRYCRGLLVEQPFGTAQENLILLFQKNRKDYAQFKDGGKLKSFLRLWVFIHGIFFGHGKQNKVDAATLPTYNAELKHKCLNAIRGFVKENTIGEVMMLKLFVINIFAMERLR